MFGNTKLIRRASSPVSNVGYSEAPTVQGILANYQRNSFGKDYLR